MGVEKKIFKDLIISYYMVIFAPPWGLNPCPRDHEFHNIDERLCRLQNHAFRFSQIGMGVEKTIFRVDECSFNGQNNGRTIKLCVILLFIVLSLILC